MRPSGRATDEMRSVSLEIGIGKYAEGSCLTHFGDTHVLCTASVEDSVPPWMRNSGRGWVTAEYGMLPRSTDSRTDREAVRGRQTGRTQEIQRLIGRSLRAVTNLNAMGEIQVRVDCDVLQADGGTRTASITGAYVAMGLAVNQLIAEGNLLESPFLDPVAAVSVGIVEGTALLDLCYVEDVVAEVDMNLVMTATGQYIEIQGTGEEATFSAEQLNTLLALGREGVAELGALQQGAISQG